MRTHESLELVRKIMMALELLTEWTDHGWLRPLDRAFALFLKDQQPDASEMVLLAAALASHQLGRGHICLDLEAAAADPDATLSLPPEGETGEKLPVRPSERLCGISKAAWERALEESPLVELPGSKDCLRRAQGMPLASHVEIAGRPLILSEGRLYLRRYWTYTLQVGEGISRRLSRSFEVPDDLSRRLDILFESLRGREEQEKGEVHWQSVAAAIAARSSFSVISGGPGTGKTTTVVQLLGLLQGMALEQGQKLRIRLAAPTGKAAARLTESIAGAVGRLPENIQPYMPAEVTTLHRLLGSRPGTRHFIHNSRNRLHVDLLVVDEASMIDLEMMAALLTSLPERARLILLGDKDQLASVEAGSVLGDICRNAEKACYTKETIAWIKHNTGYELLDCEGTGNELAQHIVVLRKSHRFGEKSGIGALSRAVNAGDPMQVNRVWEKGFPDIQRLTIASTDDKLFAGLVLDGNKSAFSEFQQADKVAGYRAYLEKVAKRAGGEPPVTELNINSLNIHPGALEKDASDVFLNEDDWLRDVIESFGRFQLLTPLRKGTWGVEGLNKKTAQVLYKEGLIPATSGWYTGRPVMVTRNDYTLGLMNGDIGILLPVTDLVPYETDFNKHENSDKLNKGGKSSKTPKTTLKVVFPMPDNTLKKVLPSRLSDVETVFAMTVHKSQGSEFDHAALMIPDTLSPVMTRELVYTGITRARNCFSLAGPNLELMEACVMRRIHRASGLWEQFK